MKTVAGTLYPYTLWKVSTWAVFHAMLYSLAAWETFGSRVNRDIPPSVSHGLYISTGLGWQPPPCIPTSNCFYPTGQLLFRGEMDLPEAVLLQKGRRWRLCGYEAQPC